MPASIIAGVACEGNSHFRVVAATRRPSCLSLAISALPIWLSPPTIRASSIGNPKYFAPFFLLTKDQFSGPKRFLQQPLDGADIPQQVAVGFARTEVGVRA